LPQLWFLDRFSFSFGLLFGLLSDLLPSFLSDLLSTSFLASFPTSFSTSVLALLPIYGLCSSIYVTPSAQRVSSWCGHPISLPSPPSTSVVLPIVLSRMLHALPECLPSSRPIGVAALAGAVAARLLAPCGSASPPCGHRHGCRCVLSQSLGPPFTLFFHWSCGPAAFIVQGC